MCFFSHDLLFHHSTCLDAFICKKFSFKKRKSTIMCLCFSYSEAGAFWSFQFFREHFIPSEINVLRLSLESALVGAENYKNVNKTNRCWKDVSLPAIVPHLCFCICADIINAPEFLTEMSVIRNVGILRRMH